MSVHAAGVYVLVFCTGGQAQLEKNGEVIWYSDDDDEFREEVTDEFLKASDQQKILEYLIDIETLTEDEAETCEVEVESLDDEDTEDDEDDEEEKAFEPEDE